MPDIQQKFKQVTVRIQRMELPNKTISKLHHFQVRPRAILPNFGFGMRKFAHHREENESISKHHRQIESCCLVLMALNVFPLNVFPWVQYSQRPAALLQQRTRRFQEFRIEENAAAHRQRDAFIMSHIGF